MKHVKMVLYGEPGVGKSTFFTKAPKPFYICTDGNYEFLDLPDKDHVQVNSWSETVTALNEEYEEYETLILDLCEDTFKWCEQEFCKKNKIDHVGDLGYGKGYDITRNSFFIEIAKFLSKDKNIAIVMHGQTIVEKDRRGVEHTKYVPSTRIPDKVLDMIEGRVRYFLRCYTKAEDEEGKLVKNRYLSLIPKENEYGICRGIDESTTPHDILLDFNEFAKIIGLDMTYVKKPATKKAIKEEKLEEKVEKVKEEKEEVKVEKIEKVEEIKEEKIKKEPVISSTDRIAAIKAKLAMMNKQ